MKKQLILTLTCLGITLKAFAQDCCYTASSTDCFGFESVLTFDIGGGYRQDNIEWKTYPVAAPGTVIKEKWKDVGMGIVETNAQFLACDHYLFKFDFDWGWFNKSGKQEVTNFDFNTNLLTQSLHSRTKGRVYNIDGKVGYQFNFGCYRYAITPLIGYSYHFQKLKNNEYHNELTGLTNNYTNNYKYRWRGPTVGVAAAFQIECNWQLFFEYTFHWARYRAKFVDSFLATLPGKQKSNNAHGNEYTLGTSYEFCPDWLLIIKVNYKNFFNNKGRTETVTDFGNDISPLRKLRWESLNATIDVAYVF